MVRPTSGQVEDLIHEVKTRVARGERALVTTLTKRLAEDLAEFLAEAGVRTTYLHSDIDAIERVEILHALRAGETQCLVGVNLLREGLDLPEVSLVCIFDADKEGFLRSQTSLIQTIGRAARHIAGEVILYADAVSPAMRDALAETERRREYQKAYNIEHGITPKTAHKQDTSNTFAEQIKARRVAEDGQAQIDGVIYTAADVPELTRMMVTAAEELHFEQAARIRDQIKAIEAHGSVSAEAQPVKKVGRDPRGRRRRRR
jgi:excinuclease ABC subunit B